MKLVDLTVKGFMDTLGSDAPAPGGGSAAALAATMGTSLIIMVSQLTIGKAKYAEFEEEMKSVLEKAQSVNANLLAAIDKDTEAFNKVSAVFSMPKETDEDKAARKEAMQVALKGAAQSPFDMMKMMLEALQICHQAVGKSNVNAASDLGVAAVNLKAGLQGAWLNILINLSGIKDEVFVNDFEGKGQEMLATGSQLADEIFKEIEVLCK